MRAVSTFLILVLATALAAAGEASSFVPLTPPPPSTPRITGPRVVGARPNRPFLFRIPATGERPMRFAIQPLPAGLMLDAERGILSGTTGQPGTTTATITATNALGEASATLDLVIGDALCLTPTLGWNSWNRYGPKVDEEAVRANARALIDSGLADHGFDLIAIDDGWAGQRDAEGALQPLPAFPDLKRLCDDLHAMGLKAGIYSSPGPITCAGFTGSYGHVQEDARRFAALGFDFLKYDICTLAGMVSPLDGTHQGIRDAYAEMAKAVASTDRDIVFNLCEWGISDPWTWAKAAGGHSWRTRRSIVDNWVSMSECGFGQDGLEAFAGPGGWNDPDMLVIGEVAWGDDPHPARLSPDEQYTHVTLWCMLAAPLVLGCDLTRLDAFTLGLVSNDEVLAVDQDRLGRQGRRVRVDGKTECWAKPLADGSLAVALFNRGYQPVEVVAPWPDLGLSGGQRVRDLWRQQDIGVIDDAWTVRVGAHGCAMARLWPAHAVGAPDATGDRP